MTTAARSQGREEDTRSLEKRGQEQRLLLKSFMIRTGVVGQELNLCIFLHLFSFLKIVGSHN